MPPMRWQLSRDVSEVWEQAMQGGGDSQCKGPMVDDFGGAEVGLGGQVGREVSRLGGRWGSGPGSAHAAYGEVLVFKKFIYY